MINIIHIPTGRGGMRRGGNEIIRERFPYIGTLLQYTFSNLDGS